MINKTKRCKSSGLPNSQKNNYFLVFEVRQILMNIIILPNLQLHTQQDSETCIGHTNTDKNGTDKEQIRSKIAAET